MFSLKPYLTTILLTLILLGCGNNEEPQLTQIEQAATAGGLPIGFNRSAGIITWNAKGNPTHRQIPTISPVLHFAGYNSNASRIAYTGLDRILNDSSNRRISVSWRDSLELTLNDLVPNGILFVEEGGKQRTISDAKNEFVVFASWSPTNPNVLAYSYTKVERQGIVVLNVSTMTRINTSEGDLNPDVFIWNSDGQALTVYTNEATAKTLDLTQNTFVDGTTSVATNDTLRPSRVDSSLEINTKTGQRIILGSLAGGKDNAFEVTNKDGSITRTPFKAEQIRTRDENGIAFVNTNGSSIELYALSSTGASSTPMFVQSALAVTYYIPNPAGSTVNFTQIGQSYPGGGCVVTSHTSSSTMGYAIDTQISGSSYDGVLASAAGTISSYSSSITCNSADTSGCSHYIAGCSANGGWGNYVIIAHSDGYYTKYTHLEPTNFQVHTVGATASAGCWLANEGYTGASAGSKNGCGDHLHFQKQSSSSLSGSSVSVSFYEDSSITSADCVAKTPTRGAMSCSM